MRRTHRTAASLSLALAALLAAFGLARADDAPPPPKAPPAPAAPALSEKEAARAAILRAVDEVREEVSKNRGLPWKTRVPAEVLSREELKARITEMIKEDLDPVKYALQVRFLKRLGMLRADEDPLEIQKKFLESGVAGYYDPKKKTFYVIEGFSPDAQRPTIAHEMTHALDDQYFDIKKRLDDVKDDSDKEFATTCTIEGCAEHARLLYQDAHAGIAALFAKESAKDSAGQMGALMTAPAFLVLPTLLHYQVGPTFVKAAVGQDFKAGMQRLFDDPPTTEEQVLHPKKFLGKDRDLPRKIVWGGDLAKALGDGWKKADEEVVGELDFALWLDFHLGSTRGRLNMAGMAQGQYVIPSVRKAAEGWDGIWVDMLEKEGQPTGIALASAWDSAKDADEAADALRAAMSAQYGSAFKGTEWATDASGRSTSWVGSNGAGRLLVRGDEVRMADGFSAEDLDRVFGVLLKTTFDRDPKDTYSEASQPDALAGADWKDEKHGLGWKAPSAGWTAEPAAGATSRVALKKGATELRVEVREGNLMTVAATMVPAIMRRAKGFDFARDASELQVAGKAAISIPYETTGEEGGAGSSRHVVYVVGLENGTLVAEVQATTGFEAAAKDAAEAMKGFLVRD